MGELKRTKVNPKVVGLKSSLVVGDEVYMTSFGRGNDAIIEKRVTNEKGIETINNNRKFKLSEDPKTGEFVVSTKRIEGTTENPLKKDKPVRENIIGCKKELENEFFEEIADEDEQREDNVYIQIAYNILDINKILSVHINNIIYALSNVAGFTGEQDLIGNISATYSYDRFINTSDASKDDSPNVLFEKFVKSNRLCYFGNAFYNLPDDKKAVPTSSKKNGENSNKDFKSNEDIYNMLALIGSARQMLSHSTTQAGHYIYNFDKIKEGNPNAIKMLDCLYDKKIKSLNDNFLKNSKFNLYLIFNAFDAQNDDNKKRDIIKSYYDFVVRKTSKNMGFSIKKLREYIIQTYDERQKKFKISDEHNDSIRSKLYGIFDFILYYCYSQNPALIDNFVKNLRACSSEEDKIEAYAFAAKKCWGSFNLQDKMIFKVFNHLTSRNLKDEIENADKNARDEAKFRKDALKGVMISSNEVNTFVKYIYMLTLFIDGKEINDLLTTLINKFENIASFFDVLKDSNFNCPIRELKADYKLFETSNDIASNLRVVNSFARMQVGELAPSDEILEDAMALLGAENPAYEVKNIRENERKVREKKISKDANGFRNFICNNVIKSSRFKYIARYSDVKGCRELAKNRKIVEFVLNEIPETQIKRYYLACNNAKKTADKERMISSLAKIIGNIELTEFKDVKNNDRRSKDPKDRQTKGQYRAIISLYLTVLYLVNKNLVYVNSRYTLAFHCLERDFQLLMNKNLNSVKKKQLPAYFKLTEDFLNNNKLSAKAKHNIEQNLYWVNSKTQNDRTGINKQFIHQYRNSVTHLNVIRDASRYLKNIKNCNSYFAMYQYIIQCQLLEYAEENKDDVEYEITSYSHRNEKRYGVFNYKLHFVRQTNGYCKDLVKMINLPFAYNYARYQCLTCEGLFDKNRPMSTK